MKLVRNKKKKKKKRKSERGEELRQTSRLILLPWVEERKAGQGSSPDKATVVYVYCIAETPQ